MTLSDFEKRLKLINPELHIKVRGYGDVAGLYGGPTGYICRLTKGDFQTNGYRTETVDPNNPMENMMGGIKKRGRKTVINFLRNYRWLKNHRDRSLLMGYITKEDYAAWKGVSL